MTEKNSLLKTRHKEDLKTSYLVTGSSLLNQCGTFCDLEIGYLILHSSPFKKCQC